MLDVLAAAGSQLTFFPEAFTALMHFLRESPRLNSTLRKVVENVSFDLVKLMAKSAEKIRFPSVAKRWNQMVAWFLRKQQVLGTEAASE
jgi:hypothetical protein